MLYNTVPNSRVEKMSREGNSNCQTGKLEPVEAVVHLAHLNRNIIGALRLELHTIQVPHEMHNYREPSINVHVFLSQ